MSKQRFPDLQHIWIAQTRHRPGHGKRPQIAIAGVIRLFDGALAPTRSVSEYFYEATPIQKEAKILNLFKDIRDYVAKKLEEATIADVV